MEQAHKSHRPQNIITKCTWHQLQEVLISLTQILSRAVNYGKDRMYVLRFSVANGTWAPRSIIRAELGMDPCNTLLRSREQCFSVSLIDHIHFVFGCGSCVLSPLWFLRCFPGIHSFRSSGGHNGVTLVFHHLISMRWGFLEAAGCHMVTYL